MLPPRTVFGLPAYNGERHLAEALESLLVQTRSDLAVIVLDDGSTDRTEEIARSYARLDPRVSYERNGRTLGLVLNWRRVLELALQRHPAASYFAWASDHDVWHPRWLEALAGELDSHPQAVLAYPRFVRMDDEGAEFPVSESLFDTAGVDDPVERMRQTIRHATAGGTVYGLMRLETLRRSDPFPLVILPDRLYVVRLALEGEFRQVARRLWYRRYRFGVVMSFGRQRRAFFPDGVPLWAHIPWWLAHTVLLVRSLKGHRRRLRLGAVYLSESLRHLHVRRRAQRELRRRRRRRSRGLPSSGPGPIRREAHALLRWLAVRVLSARRHEQPRWNGPASRPAAGDPRDEAALSVHRLVQSEVRRMTGGPLRDLEDLADASPAVIATLRRHAHRVGGASPDAYESGDAAARYRHERKFAALERAGGNGLLAYEPPRLGGFGFEIGSGLVNIDTLRFSEAMIALERAELLREIATEGVVVEIGGGWGGLAYQLKSRFPGVTYVIVDRPERFLLSAVYLLSMFPDARPVFWHGSATDSGQLEGADFVFVPEAEAASVPLERVDLVASVASFETLPAASIDRHLDWLSAAGTPSLYSLNRDRSADNPGLPSLRRLLERDYWLYEVWVLRWAHDQWVGENVPAAKPRPTAPEPVAYDPDRYHHLIGRRRLVSAAGRLTSE